MWLYVAVFCLILAIPFIFYYLSLYVLNDSQLYRFKYGLYVYITIVVSTILLPIFAFRPYNAYNIRLASYLLNKIYPHFGLRYNLENKHFLHIDGPYIVVANHQSSIDFIGMMNLWTDHIKYCSVLAKKELLYAGPFGVTAWLAGVEFINRMNSKQAAITMKSIMEKIKLKNLRLWIFPEGTRNMDDEFRPFKSGAFRLAIQGQIPIIPVVFSSYKEIYSPNKSNLFWKNGVVTIRCLEPIETKHMTMDDFPQLTTTVREKMMKEFNMLKTIPDI